MSYVRSGCLPCECSPGGSTSSVCDKLTGQCACRDRIHGRRCDGLQPGFYIPDVHFLSAQFERRTNLASLLRHLSGYKGDGFVEATSNVCAHFLCYVLYVWYEYYTRIHRIIFFIIVMTCFGDVTTDVYKYSDPFTHYDIIQWTHVCSGAIPYEQRHHG